MKEEFLSQLIQAALLAATAQRVPVTVAIVDAGGHLRALHRQQECSFFALEASRKKAVTASQLKIPSKIVGELSQKFPALQASFAANPEVLGLPGGLPIQLDGRVVGGLGIAGGNFEQDQLIAEAALAVIS